MKTYKIKRLWNGLASVRDYMVEQCITEKEDLLLRLEKQDGTTDMMLIPWQELSTRSFQATKQGFDSKVNRGQSYALVDFQWKPAKRGPDGQLELF